MTFLATLLALAAVAAVDTPARRPLFQPAIAPDRDIGTMFVTSKRRPTTAGRRPRALMAIHEEAACAAI